MPKITFIDYTGQERTVEAELGETVMKTARRLDIPGIDADCGGKCACATCHVKVDEDWMPKVGGRGETEDSMLAYATDVSANSRLSCQVEVTADLDGLRVTTPESQS
jgi:2Fe-2S ferredoxin